MQDNRQHFERLNIELDDIKKQLERFDSNLQKRILKRIPIQINVILDELIYY